jgi:hypothetical protein
MAAESELDGQWESQAQVDACLAETGVTKDQVVRWRREGLLPKGVDQDQFAYRGSVVRFPCGTCTQIRVANELFKQKNRTDHVGLWLWWLGYPVGEKHWRPQLLKAGRLLDRMAPNIAWFINRSDRRDSETIYDRAESILPSKGNIVLSRIRGRVDAARMPTVLRVVGETATGDFTDFDPHPGGVEGDDQRALVEALDLSNASKHSILGHRLNAVELLPSGLGNVAAAMKMGHFAGAAAAPAQDVAAARNDGKYALLIAYYLYEASRWIYGDGAFGMRLLAMIVRKTPLPMMSLLTLVMFRLRQVPEATQSSNQIEQMARTAQSNWLESKKLEHLWRTDSRYSILLSPKRIKLAFADEIALKRWQRELNAITVDASNIPTSVSGHESESAT